MPTELRLLLIEDSPDDSDLLIQHLKKSGLSAVTKRVETILNLKTALEKEVWDIIICDYNLPAFDALDAISVVRESNLDIPCIVVSGSVGEEKAVETMRAGANDFILKDNLARLVPVLQRVFKEAEIKREKKSIETNLKKSEENLRQAQKLESIGQLAGGIAHDFNNLLATILLQSEVLKEGLDKKLPILDLVEYVEKGTEQIMKTTERATNLTRQLLAFSRKQVVLPKTLNLNSLIIDMEKMLRRIVEENIEFKTNLAPDLKNLKIDPGHLEQIIMNLIVNCRDAMPKGGQLRIETTNSFVDELTAKSCNVKAGPHVLLTISDTGMGMSEEVKKHLFEPFFTTKPVGKGTGLGLCTVYGIVKQNKGLIFIESEEGKGTRFKLFFPMTDDQVQTVVAVKQIETVKGTESILVVEDEEDLRELICATLAGNGYIVLSASTGLDALNQIKAHEKPIDLVITDVVMPQMGGPELAKQAMLLNKKIKFLFQSGYAKEALTQDGMSENQIHFLAKPYPLKDLLNKIRAILET